MIFDPAQLQSEIGRRLYQLAISHEFPLHEQSSLDSFKRAFESIGGAAKIIPKENGRKFTVSLTKVLDNARVSPVITIERGAIFDGCGTEVYGSVRALQCAISLIYHKFGHALPKDLDRETWSDFEDRATTKTRITLEHELRKNFMQYHENMLKDTDFKEGRIGPGRIFPEICQQYPVELYGKATEIWSREDDQRKEVTLRNMIEEPWNIYDDDRCPTPETVLSFLWGAYMERLAERKGYQTKFEGNALKWFILTGENVLKSGRRTFGTALRNEKFAKDYMRDNK